MNDLGTAIVIEIGKRILILAIAFAVLTLGIVLMSWPYRYETSKKLEYKMIITQDKFGADTTYIYTIPLIKN